MASGSGWNVWVWLAGGGCGWNLWVWLVGVVVRRYSVGHQESRKCFQSMYIISVILHAIDKQDIST